MCGLGSDGVDLSPPQGVGLSLDKYSSRGSLMIIDVSVHELGSVYSQQQMVAVGWQTFGLVFR
jgi:hypothetical protein